MEKQPEDRRIRRTRGRIRKSLFKLIRTIPYEKIRIAQIAQAADISRSTFYLHYETKDDLVTSVLDEIIASYIHALDKPAGKNSHQPSYLLFSLWKDHMDEIQLIVNSGLEYRIYQRLHAFHVKHDYLRNIENSLLNNYLHAMINGATFALLLQWTKDGGKVPIQQMVQLHDCLNVEMLFELAEVQLPDFGKT